MKIETFEDFFAFVLIPTIAWCAIIWMTLSQKTKSKFVNQFKKPEKESSAEAEQSTSATATKRNAPIDPEEAMENVIEISGIFADLNEAGEFIKSQSKLPCTWDVARKSFKIAYKHYHSFITEEQDQGFHSVYRELAYFVEEKERIRFQKAMDLILKETNAHERERYGERATVYTEVLIVGFEVGFQPKEKTKDRLVNSPVLRPKGALLAVAEIAGCCGEQYKLMWDEWADYANHVSGKKQRIPMS